MSVDFCVLVFSKKKNPKFFHQNAFFFPFFLGETKVKLCHATLFGAHAASATNINNGILKRRERTRKNLEKKMIPVKKRSMKAPPKKKKKKSNGSVLASSSSSSFSFEENEIRAPDSNLAARVNLDAFQRALKNLSIAPQSSSTSSLSSSSRIQNYPRLRFDVGTRVEFKYTDRSKNESHEITGTISAHWVKCPCRACREEGSEDRFPYEVAVDEAWKDLIDNETWLLQRDNNEYVRLETTGCFTSKRRPKLRFEVGDRVQATVSAYSDNKTTMWETGTIVNVWSRPSGWNLSDGCALPYEIRIHDVTKEHLHAERDIVYAPYDADECVRKERRETVGPPTALSKVFLELPDLF